MLTLEKFEEASEVVKKVTLETKLIYSEYFSENTGNKVWFKPENMQYLVKLVSQMYGKEMRIKLIEDDTDNKKADDLKDLPFNIIE